MALADDLSSRSPAKVLTALLGLFHEITASETLAIDQEYYQANDHMHFLAEFESADGKTKPARAPRLLKEWMHYIWVKLELTFLANQRSTLNKVKKYRKAIHANKAAPFEMTAFPDSVARAIQDDVLHGVKIQDSIAVVKKMVLQIIGTEHPTDPWSEKVRVIIAKLANAISAEDPDAEEIKDLLKNLSKHDSIPPTQRSLVDEATRDLEITSKMLYNTLPNLIYSVLDAYRTYYSKNPNLEGLSSKKVNHEAYSGLFKKNVELLMQAMEGENGLPFDTSNVRPFVQDVSWAGGFDVDGNEKAAIKDMIYAARLRRIWVSEQHAQTLKTTIIHQIKIIEKDIREELANSNNKLTVEIRRIAEFYLSATACKLFQSVAEYLNAANQCKSERKYREMLDIIINLKTLINKEAEILEFVPDKCDDILINQISQIRLLIQVTAFAGLSRAATSVKNKKGIIETKEADKQGDLNNFLKVFDDYRAAIRSESKDIDIVIDDTRYNASQYVVKKYENILSTHQALLDQFPDIKLAARIFGMQLRAYGMTFGLTHIRQDSSMYTEVWGALLDDQKNYLLSLNIPKLNILLNQEYSQLTYHQKHALHRIIQTTPSITEHIFQMYRTGKFQNEDKYKHTKQFILVQRELERIELALANYDMVENIIISNSEHRFHIDQVQSLLQIFPSPHRSLKIVPLIEKRADILNYEEIVLGLIKTTLQAELTQIYLAEEKINTFDLQVILEINSLAELTGLIESFTRESIRKLLASKPALKNYFSPIVIEVMFGFSDTERVSGTPALISIQQVQEDFIKLVQDFGLTPKRYHGPGGDNNRGGSRRRDEKATLQGRERSDRLTTAEAASWHRETQFYHTYKQISHPLQIMEFTKQPNYILDLIKEFEEIGVAIYEKLHDTQNGLGKLYSYYLGVGVHPIASVLNSSSRASQRKDGEEISGDRTSAVQTGGIKPARYVILEKSRAITATHLKELPRDYVDLLMGPGGLRHLGLEKAICLFDNSPIIRDMVYKTMIGIAMADFKITAYSLFGMLPDCIFVNLVERARLAKKCQEEYPQILKQLSLENINPVDAEPLLLVLFAAIVEEAEQTKAFIFEMMRNIYFEEYRTEGAPKNLNNPVDIFYHVPNVRSQLEKVVQFLEPASMLLARLIKHISSGRNLDDVYLGLNDQVFPNSELTPVGALLGSVGTAAAAGRITQPAIAETVELDYSQNLRAGFYRADGYRESTRSEMQKQLNKISQQINVLGESKEESIPIRQSELEAAFNILQAKYTATPATYGRHRLFSYLPASRNEFNLVNDFLVTQVKKINENIESVLKKQADGSHAGTTSRIMRK
jgi:hypothetical protein